MNFDFKNIFEPELLEDINNIVPVEIPKNSVILREDAYINQIPLVLEGIIKVRKADETGKEIVLYHIEPGESCILSITSCLNDKVSKAEAIIEKNAKIAIITATQVKEWMDLYKSWRKFVLQLYYTRLDELLTLVDSISFKQTDLRLVEKLQELQTKQGNKITITHQELANHVGTAREVISRLLKKLENDGYLKLDRGVINIIQPL